MIRTERLSKIVGRRTVLDEITFAVEKGEAVEIVGHPGSGKSTLLRILATLTRPTSGQIEIGGIDAVARPFDVRRRVFLSSAMGLGREDMSIGQFLQFIVATRTSGERRAAADQASLIDRIGLSVDRKLDSLTAAEQRLVALATSIASRAGVLLIDDPVIDADVTALERYRTLMSEACGRGMTVVAAAGVEALPSPLWNRRIHLQPVEA